MKYIILLAAVFFMGCNTTPKSGTYNDDSITWDNTKWDCNWKINGGGMDCLLRQPVFKNMISDNICSPDSEFINCYNSCRNNSQDRDEMDLCPRNCHRKVCLSKDWLY